MQVTYFQKSLNLVIKSAVTFTFTVCVLFERPCERNLYILDAQLGLWVSLEHAFTCASTTKLSDAQELPTSWLGGSRRYMRGLQPGGNVHK